jgi:DNA-binding transcriptional LysR family regulator
MPQAWRLPSWGGTGGLGVGATRRITLTHEGSAFLEDCQRLLTDIANAEASVSAGGVKASGHLRITAPAGFGRRHVAPLVPRFRELHADVTISLNLSDRVVDIAGEGYDCAVRVGDMPDSSLVSVRWRLATCAWPRPSSAARYAEPRCFVAGIAVTPRGCVQCVEAAKWCISAAR